MAEPEMTEVPVTSPYRALVQEIAPPWLSDRDSYKFTYSAIGIIFDALAEYLRLGVLQRFPGVAQSSALPFIGSDRKMLRGFRESDAAYIPRLRGAFETWKFAGNAQTLLTELAAYFSPNAPVIRYVVNGDQAGVPFTDWWTLQDGEFTHVRRQGTGHNNWNWDGQVGQIRFWIIIYRNEGFTPWFWGDGHFWGGGQSWGFEENFTENFAADARNIINQWKAAGSHCLFLGGIIVTGDTSLFDPNGNGANYPNGTWDVYSNRAGIPTTFYLNGT
jgi:hypothetical protein